MREQPVLETNRLVLRLFTLADAPRVQHLLRDREIASTTMNIPFPYEDGMAEAWISSSRERYEQGEVVNFALVLRADGKLIGAMGLRIDQEHGRAELGYWIGKNYWNQGYATEAAQAVVQYGFETGGLNRIHASHLTRNPASGRVMQKIGMQHEGRLRQHVRKWEVFEDLEIYGLLKSDYEAR